MLSPGVTHFTMHTTRSGRHFRRTGIRTLLAASLLLVAGSAKAEKTDEVVLDTGNTIVGEVKNLVQGKLKYSTDQAGTIYIE